MAALLLLVERVLVHVISLHNDINNYFNNNLPSNDVLCPVNVNLRQWTDIVTYIEDITSSVNDRYSNVHRRHYKSGQCSPSSTDRYSNVHGDITSSVNVNLRQRTDIVTYMETLQVQSMTDIVTYMETLQVQSMYLRPWTGLTYQICCLMYRERDKSCV